MIICISKWSTFKYLKHEKCQFKIVIQRIYSFLTWWINRINIFLRWLYKTAARKKHEHKTKNLCQWEHFQGDNYESDLYNKWITNKQIAYSLQPLRLSIFLYSWMLQVSLVITMWTRICCCVPNTESLFHQLRHENEKIEEPEHHQSVTLHLICSSSCVSDHSNSEKHFWQREIFQECFHYFQIQSDISLVDRIIDNLVDSNS